MKYAIVVSSRTGNTALLAGKMKKTLGKKYGEEACVYYGAPNVRALLADRIYIGFWTDKGKCDDIVEEFLSGLQDKEIFIFGTAGFGGSDTYFAQIIARIEEMIPNGNKILGTYMCQGKMPASVRARYEKLREEAPDNAKFEAMIANFDKASTHPDEDDLERLEKLLYALD